MLLNTALLLAAMLPQNDASKSKPKLPDPGLAGRLQLPAVPRKTEAREVRRTDGQISDYALEQFAADLNKLATKTGAGRSADSLQWSGLRAKYRDLDELMLATVRTARPDLLKPLMVAMRRHGREQSARHADELEYQLALRTLGSATDDVVDALVELRGEDAKAALFSLLDTRFHQVRRLAVARLKPVVTVEDVPFATAMTRQRSLDLVMAGIELLGAIDDETAGARLIDLLAKKPAVAAAACRELISMGPSAANLLVQALKQPAEDRSIGYAGFALARIEGSEANASTGANESSAWLVGPEIAAMLDSRLDAPDALERVLVAIPLARMSFRDVAEGFEFRDRKIVDALLLMSDTRSFMPNASMLSRPAEAQLVALSGREPPQVPRGWVAWWEDARKSFKAMRSHVSVDADLAGRMTVVRASEGVALRFLGEELAGRAPRTGARDVVLTGAEMLAFVTALQSAGFMTDAYQDNAPGSLPRVRELEIETPNARARVAATQLSTPSFDRLDAVVQAVVADQTWQLYRHPKAEPDRAAAWRSGRRFLKDQTDPIERDRWLLRRIVRSFPTFSAERDRVLALRHLLAIEDREALLTEDDGQALIALAADMNASASKVDEVTQTTLLQVALQTPGDTVWRLALDLVDRQAQAGQPAEVSRLLALLGPERIRASLADNRRSVSLAAMSEVAKLRDRAAGPDLLALIDSEDNTVRRSAIWALGQIEYAPAKDRVIKVVTAEDAIPDIRQEGMKALGRIGGEGVFPVLEAALTFRDRRDREAAVRGLASLDDPRSAPALAQTFVGQVTEPLGREARLALENQGAEVAKLALRPHLQTANPSVRASVAMLLGRFQDPAAIPALLELLDVPGQMLQAGALLEGITGLNLNTVTEALPAMRSWYSTHKSQSQSSWLMQALTRSQFNTNLTLALLAPEAGLAAVPELARVMRDSPEPQIRVLASAVLRQVTGEDYGLVFAATPPSRLQTIADRYKFFADHGKAAAGARDDH